MFVLVMVVNLVCCVLLEVKCVVAYMYISSLEAKSLFDMLCLFFNITK